MQRRLYPLTLLAFLTLAACSSPGQRSLAHSKTFAPRVNIEKRDESISLTETARAHLAADRLGLAVELFRDALANGEAPAPALNGLGVAYARLGRADLARLYFTRAAASDPANPRFAENLALLMRKEALAQIGGPVSGPKTAHAAATAPSPSPATANALTATARTSSSIQRLSRGEVLIVTSGPEKPQPAKAHSPIRIEWAAIRRSAAVPESQGASQSASQGASQATSRPKSRTISFASR